MVVGYAHLHLSSFYSKNNERFLGIKMKKVILMLLALSLLCLAGCKEKKPSKNEDPQPTPAPVVESAVEKMCTIANGSKPTKTITLVTLVTNAEEPDTLTGSYSTVTDGTDVIFEYRYQRFNTPAESLETGNYDRILTFSGVVNYHDGVYSSGEGDEWRPGTGTALDLKLNFDVDLFKNAVANEEGNVLEVKFTAEELKSFIGTNLNAVGEATVVIAHNDVNLSAVTVTCSTENGSLMIRTSYTYNVQDLFPEVDE